ncbi:MAG: hypothetical protein AB7O24_14185 [Kofleriaceae bacterium]
MYAIAAMLALTTSGCATIWTIGKVAGTDLAPSENVREVSVPKPGVTERLTVFLDGDRPNRAPHAPEPLVRLSCHVDQLGPEDLYRSESVYASGWKWSMLAGVLVEGLAAAALYASRDEEPGAEYAAGLFAVDAVASAGLLLLQPRKDLFTHEQRVVTTRVRSTCPEGVSLDIAGNTFRVDSTGDIGELGSTALGEWMNEPTGAVIVRFETRTAEFRIGDAQRCEWLRRRDPKAAQSCVSYGAAPMFVKLDLPVGTATRVVAQ